MLKKQAGEKPTTVVVPDNEHNQEEINKNSQNLFFTGDNLEVLRHLQNNYRNSIDVIYIDPPYNTGNDGFVYPDSFEYSDEVLQDVFGLNENELNKLKSIQGKSTHSAWLTFMYPRLLLAKKILSEEGFMFISIDDNEQELLKLTCHELYGSDNLEEAIWQKQGNDGKSIFSGVSTIRNDHEMIYIVYKNRSLVEFNRPLELIEYKNNYGNADNDFRGNWMSAELGKSDARTISGGKNYYTIVSPTGVEWTRQWHYSEEEMKKIRK